MSFLYKDSIGSAKDCLNFPERPSTPEEIKKYRRSAYLEPGKRFQHHGIIDDLKSMDLGNKNYGASSDKGSTTAQDLINHKKKSEIERMNEIRAEKVYKGATREPLGRTVDRNIILPSKFTEGNVPFGVASKSSAEPAKEIIFPTLTDESFAGEELYKISHGSSEPGEQKRRNYDWPMDPSNAVFGNKGDTIAFNGVSRNIAEVLNSGVDERMLNTKKVEDFRGTSDVLGRSRNLGQGSAARGFDVVYGKSRSKSHHTAAEIMKGRYTSMDQSEDRDLGKSITPGFRNITTESRAFGCPSIRTDLPARPRGSRSVADSQNYGDDVPAQDLINPPAFADLATPPTIMSDARSKENLIYTFKKIGYDLDNAIYDAIFEDAARGDVVASINEFRDALNNYLDAVETDREHIWCSRHGIPYYQ